MLWILSKNAAVPVSLKHISQQYGQHLFVVLLHCIYGFLLLFVSLCYFPNTRLVFFNIFICLFSCFVRLFPILFIYVFVLFCALFLLL